MGTKAAVEARRGDGEAGGALIVEWYSKAGVALGVAIGGDGVLLPLASGVGVTAREGAMVEETVERGEDSRWVASYLSCKYLTEKPAPARRQTLLTSSRSCSLVPSPRARHTSFAILACLTISATVE